jgi:hypothetical protein
MESNQLESRRESAGVRSLSLPASPGTANPPEGRRVGRHIRRNDIIRDVELRGIEWRLQLGGAQCLFCIAAVPRAHRHCCA